MKDMELLYSQRNNYYWDENEVLKPCNYLVQCNLHKWGVWDGKVSHQPPFPSYNLPKCCTRNFSYFPLEKPGINCIYVVFMEHI